MILKHEVMKIDLSGKTWDQVCTILSLINGISLMPIYWHPGGTMLILGTDEDGNNLIVIR